MNVALEIVAVIVGVIFVFPVLWLVLSSFKPGNELFTFPLTFFPKNFTVENFVTAWQKMDFMLYMMNTAFVTIVATVLTVLMSAITGYALAKYRYKWMNVLFVCVLATTMLPTEVIMTPSFEVIRRLGLYNNLWGLIVPR